MSLKTTLVAGMVAAVVVGGWANHLGAQTTAGAVDKTGPNSPPAVADQAANVLLQCLNDLAEKTDEKDTHYYKDGVWYGGQEQHYVPRIAAGSAAATLWRYKYRDSADTKTRDQLHRWAVETFDRALKDHLHAEGYFGDPKLPDTVFFGVELGAAYLDLGDSLDEAARKRWRAALVSIVEYLIKNGNLDNGKRNWYTNGNIELDECELVYDVWKITGEAKYKELFENQWQFTIAPKAERWKQFGLVYTKEPTKENGSDGAAYLGESGGKEPSFDPSYTAFQSAIASRLYVTTEDPRFLRLANLLMNQLMPRVDQRTWILDATNGSRRNNRLPLFTPGLAVTAWLGGREDMAPLVEGHLEAISKDYLGGSKANWLPPGLYRGLASELGVYLQAADLFRRNGRGPGASSKVKVGESAK